MQGPSRTKRSTPLRSGAAALLALSLVAANPARADPPEPAGSEQEPAVPEMLRELEWTPPGHVEPLRFGALLSLDGSTGPEAATDFDAGFDVTDARASLRGELPEGFGYFLQTNLIQSRPLLDAVIDWKSAATGFALSAGYFRTPFSAELLIAAPVLDFIARSQIVRALAPDRQIGVQLDQQILGDALVVRAGAFNGNGLDRNDDDRFLYVLRFDGRIHGEERDAGSSGSTSGSTCRTPSPASDGWSARTCATRGDRSSSLPKRSMDPSTRTAARDAMSTDTRRASALT